MGQTNQPNLAVAGPATAPEEVVAVLGPWTEAGGPLHERLAVALGAAIDRGDLPAGVTLPTERALARAVSVSRATVGAAYAELKRSGRLRARQGSGTWVAPGPATGEPSRVAPLFRGDDGAIDLSLASPLAGPEVADALAAVAARPADALAGFGYAPTGLPPLRSRLAELLTGEGVSSGPDDVVVTVGAQQAIQLLAAALVRPGDAVVVEEATYAGAIDAFRSVGARLLPVPVGPDGADVDALEALLDRAPVALVYLVPTHHNPTGAVLAAEARQRVVALARRHDVVVVDDRVPAALGYDPDAPPPPPLAAFDRRAPVVTVGSLSKVCWGGLRTGWLRGPAPVVDAVVARKLAADLGGPVIDQHVAATLVPRYPELARRRRAELAAGHAHLVAALARELPDWEPAPARGGLSVWVRLPGADAVAVAAVAERHGVRIVPGPRTTVHGSHTDHVRLTVVLPPPVLDEAVRRLGAAWAELTGSSPARRSVVV
jgi:DNA-binding transcriptional MocR family regulator